MFAVRSSQFAFTVCFRSSFFAFAFRHSFFFHHSAFLVQLLSFRFQLFLSVLQIPPFDSYSLTRFRLFCSSSLQLSLYLLCYSRPIASDSRQLSIPSASQTPIVPIFFIALSCCCSIQILDRPLASNTSTLLHTLVITNKHEYIVCTYYTPTVATLLAMIQVTIKYMVVFVPEPVNPSPTHSITNTIKPTRYPQSHFKNMPRKKEPTGSNLN